MSECKCDEYGDNPKCFRHGEGTDWAKAQYLKDRAVLVDGMRETERAMMADLRAEVERLKEPVRAVLEREEDALSKVAALQSRLAKALTVIEAAEKALESVAKKNARGYTYDRDEAFNIATNALSALREFKEAAFPAPIVKVGIGEGCDCDKCAAPSNAEEQSK